MDVDAPVRVCSGLGDLPMHNHNDLVLRLLVVDDTAENAEATVTQLRNGGISVRAVRACNAEELQAALAAQVDLVVARFAMDLSEVQLQRHIAASGKDIGLILLAEQLDEDEWIRAATAGVHAIALRRHPAHLLAVVRSEWSNLEARRERRRIELQLRETERRCDALIASSRDPIAYVHEGMHLRANDAYLDMLGFSAFEDIEGIPLLDVIATQDVDAFKLLLKSIAKGDPPPAKHPIHARSADGATFAATMEFATASYEGEPCIQVVFRRHEDIDPELIREVEVLRQRDQVTGLLNRATFMAQLEDAIAEAGRGAGQSGLLLIQPDHYSKILHELGLDTADALIAAIAAQLSAALPADAIAARVGEHNFAVALSGDHRRTTQTAETIRQGFDGHLFSVGARSTAVTVSIGGVQIGEKITNVSQILQHASDQLRATLTLGGNAISVHDPGALDRVEQERIQRWLDQLHQALAGEGFVLYYQPILNLQSQPLELYQASLRLRRDDELIEASSFMEIASEHGLSADIDRWMLREVIGALGERQRAGHITHVTMSIGPDSFADPQLIATLSEQLSAQQLPGERLWLQLQESKVFTHLKNAQQLLQRLSPLGCKLGLEQFGSGLDSFQVLRHIQPAFLRIDPGLSAEITSNEESRQRVSAISERANAAGITTLAESVSDPATLSALFSAGVGYVQGEFVAPPGPTMDFQF